MHYGLPFVNDSFGTVVNDRPISPTRGFVSFSAFGLAEIDPSVPFGTCPFVTLADAVERLIVSGVNGVECR